MKVTLRFYRGIGFLAWIVRVVTRSPYAHVELVINNEAFVCRPGVKCHKRYVDKVDSQAEVEIEPIEGFYLRAHEALGANYDLWGAIRSGSKFGREHPTKWFCSELAAYAIGLPDPHTRSPGDLAKFYKLTT
jgi:hypothetical protein